MNEEVWEYEERLSNSLGWLLRHAFFGAVIGDILKAIHGQAYIGAFTLSMCTISALAELEWCNKNQNFIDAQGTILAKSNERPTERDVFIGWVQKWLNNKLSDEKYDSANTYAIRCALTHSYGWARQLNKTNVNGYLLYRRHPQYHCSFKNDKDGKSVYCLNLENFVADIIFGADNCIQYLSPDLEGNFLNYVRALIAPKKLTIGGNVVVDSELISLDFFDKRLIESPLQVDKSEIIDKVRDLYK